MENYEIRINKDILIFENSKILYCFIQSSHSNSTKYRVYIKYNPKKSDIESIESWYCICKSGARTVGCCSHIASVILYLSNTIYLDNFHSPARKLSNIFPYYRLEESDDDKLSDDEDSGKKKVRKQTI